MKKKKLIAITLISSLLMSGMTVYAKPTEESTDATEEPGVVMDTPDGLTMDTPDGFTMETPDGFTMDMPDGKTLDSTEATPSTEANTEASTESVDKQEVKKKDDKKKEYKVDTTMTCGDFLSYVKDNKEGFTKVDNDAMFTMMKNSIDAGEDIKLGEAFSKVSGLQIPSNFMYDLSTSGISETIDMESLNLQYANLALDMDKTKTSIATDMSKNAMNATGYFQKEYGDLGKSLQIDEATLPKGMNFSKMCSQNTKSMQDAYKGLVDDSGFNSVRSSMNTSSIFEQAKSGPKQFSLASYESLSSRGADYNSQLQIESNKKKAQDYNSKQSSYLQTKSAFDAQRNEDGVYDPGGQVAEGRKNYEKQKIENRINYCMDNGLDLNDEEKKYLEDHNLKLVNNNQYTKEIMDESEDKGKKALKGEDVGNDEKLNELLNDPDIDLDSDDSNLPSAKVAISGYYVAQVAIAKEYGSTEEFEKAMNVPDKEVRTRMLKMTYYSYYNDYLEERSKERNIIDSNISDEEYTKRLHEEASEYAKQKTKEKYT